MPHRSIAMGIERSMPSRSHGLPRLKWIHHPEEHSDQDGQTLATREVEVILAWAEARNAAPATLPGCDADWPYALRFCFPGFASGLQPVSWSAWLGVFRERDLVFIYQEKTRLGQRSNFFRLNDGSHR